jgi:hypothetical protein
MQVSKGDAVTYVALVLSAGLQALEPLRKEAAMPPDLHPILSSAFWSFFPLGLLILVGILWLIRYFQHSPTIARSPAIETDNRSPVKNISAVQLEPSGEEMKLVVTPCRGQTTVQMFVDLSSWFPSHGWSQTARHYLGEMPLRSANVKFSLSVLGQAPDGVVGWFWKTLNSDGATSESHPWLIQCRQRATFVFIDATGTRDEFPLLLLPDPSTNADPVVITPDDLPIKTAP